MRLRLPSIKNSNLPILFNLQDDRARGRCVMLTSSVITSVITWLTTGLFYSSFLLINGINIVNIGIISFVPYIASCFSIFSPSILERFQSRRWVLTVSRAVYYTLNILAITVVPPLIPAGSARVAAFVALVFAANIVNALFSSGYQVWHVNFIPEPVRAGYFASCTTITSILGIGAALISSIVADAFAASPYEDTIIVALRYAAFLLALAEVVVLALPKEYPYAQSARPRLRDFFVKPFKHKKFIYTMVIVLLYNVSANVCASALNVYLLEDVGVSYTFIQLVNFAYPFFLMALAGRAQNNIRKLGWFKTFGIYTLLQVPTTLLYSCVTSFNYLYIIPIVRLTQHWLGVSANIAYANMAYVNLPREDQTNYIAFFTFVTNVAAFLGLLLGTYLISAFPEARVTILGLAFGNVQMLMWLQAIGQVAVSLLALLLIKQLDPGQE